MPKKILSLRECTKCWNMTEDLILFRHKSFVEPIFFSFIVFIALTTKRGYRGEILTFSVSYSLNDCILFVFPFTFSSTDTTLHVQRTSMRSNTAFEWRLAVQIHIKVVQKGFQTGFCADQSSSSLSKPFLCELWCAPFLFDFMHSLVKGVAKTAEIDS